MIPANRTDAEFALEACANAPSEAFDLTACALACSIHENPEQDLSNALRTLAQLTDFAHAQSPKSAEDFSMLLFAEFGFSGAKSDYDAPQNADFVSILTSRTGLPVGLGVVWRHAARIAGAPLHGTDMPGHFVMRLENDAGPLFIDPFEGGTVLASDDLNNLARQAGVEKASDSMLRPVSDRVIAIRLQTNLCARAQARGDIQSWFRAAHRRAILAPNSHQVALDYSEAAEAAGHLKTAVDWAERANRLRPEHDKDLMRITKLTHQLN